jgi:outer membrane protein OmpA-like peptidoglycan-associated protein
MPVFPRALPIALCLYAFITADAGESAYSMPGEAGFPGVLETLSSQRMKTGGMVFGVSARMNKGLEMIQDGAIQAPSETIKPEDVFTSGLQSFVAVGMGYGLDFSLQLPFYYEYLPNARSEPESWGIGDLSAIFKAELPFHLPFSEMSLFITGSVPTSSAQDGLLPKRLAYHSASGAYPDPVSHPTGTDQARLGVGVGTTFDLSEAIDNGPKVSLHFNVAGDRTMADAALDPLGTLTASTALEVRIAEGVRIESEFRHQRLVVDPSTMGSPLGKQTTFGFGLGWLTRSGFSVRLGGLVAPGVWNKYLPLAYGSGPDRRTLGYRQQPLLSGFAQVAWQGFPLGRDGDQDGLPDGKDRCPTIPEDRDGFHDSDGCPDHDNDGDLVADSGDNCPYTAEDHDGFEDRDGCPELDNDHDGDLDTVDRCPNDPEDRDGFLDDDGCPDLDDDKDAIPDAVDKCPQEAENRNGIDDEDGCPERDTDGDGIPDSRDKCPREDEIVNFFQDDDGCPDEKPEPLRDALLTGVEFQTGGSELLPGSFLVLDGLATRMFTYPGTEIEIQGHVDDRAGPGAKALTQARAETVKEYLVNRGIEARRMKPVGYGASKPLGPNRTAEGRAKNRRIQIRRLN